VLSGKTLTFGVKAGETGRLYGSVSDEDLIEAIEANYEITLEKRQVETEPIRQLGTYTVPIHLTMDLVPEITVIVHREGEVPGEEPEAGEPKAVEAEVEKKAKTVEETAETIEEAVSETEDVEVAEVEQEEESAEAEE